MGIQNRDYYRSDARSGGLPGMSGYSMCQILLIVNIVAFLLQVLITVPVYYIPQMIENVPEEQQPKLREMVERGQTRQLHAIADRYGYVAYESLLQEWGSADPLKISQGQVWRLVTYAFLHDRGSLMHLVFNMLVLWMFGSAVEQLLGRREFLAFYLAAAIFAGLCHVLFGFVMHDMTGAVGASGALMAVSMLFAIYYPTTPITIYFLFTIEARWLIILYVIFDSYPILMALSGQGPRHTGIAHAAHLGGLAFGFVYYHFHWRLTDWFPSRGGPSLGQKLARWWSRPRLRVYDSPAERPVADLPAVSRTPVRTASPRDLERRVDDILKKIKETGEASLTEEERDLLRDASQAYKKRNT